jgi:hypothetical protein
LSFRRADEKRHEEPAQKKTTLIATSISKLIRYITHQSPEFLLIMMDDVATGTLLEQVRAKREAAVKSCSLDFVSLSFRTVLKSSLLD